ncbi:MAG: HD domain-containing protein [Desulfobacterales bacterium]
MKTKFIQDLQAGDTIDDIFVLAEKNLARKRNGENYLTVTLCDRSGRIRGVMWDNLELIKGKANSGDYVRVKGGISEYKGALQFVVRDMEAIPADALDPADFVPATTRDVEKMFARLVDISTAIETPHLKRLFELFWADEEFARAFKTAPAAKKMHHAYIGGLLEHTLSMTILADRIAIHYGGVDRDMLMAGAILHDVGKIRELVYDSKIDYSDELLDEKLQLIPDFPLQQANLLKHMIISHHGAREFGSPEPPKTIEAVLLHYIDEIDARVNGIREFIASEDSDAPWTSYHRLLERHFYRGGSATS